MTAPGDACVELAPQALADALAAGGLAVHYQPIVVLPSRQVIGFEALARMRDSGGALLPPSAFIPAAERCGLIVPLGLQVLRLAVAEAARWRGGSTPLATSTISVNIAPPQLEQPDLLDTISAVLAEYDVPGSALVLEITESVATSASVRPVLERLAGLGIRIALDDFGTGFATLENLRRLPVQILKLDQSFVAGVAQAGADRAIVRAVVNLADSLGLTVIAEGVETEDQAEALLLLGCPVMQGYLFSRPDADAEAAARAVRATSGGLPMQQLRGAEPERWPVLLDGAVLSAARLLDTYESPHRGAVHAVASALAQNLTFSQESVRVVGRLALVHDVARLAVDGQLPGPLAAEPLLRALASSAGRVPREVAVVRAAVQAVDLARLVDPALSASALSVGLNESARLRRASSQPFADLLFELAESPPEAHSAAEVLDDFERRRMGRQGIEDRLRSLVGITRVLSSSRDNRELLRTALEEVRRIVGAASASLEQWERESGQLRCLVSVGQLGPGEVTFPENEIYQLAEFAQARRTLLTGLPYLHTVEDPDADPEAIELLRSLNKYSSAAVPVYLEGRMWGQIWLATEVGEPPFRAGDVELLMSVATLMGSVIVQAENLERVGRAAFEDALTRVGNRRAVDDAIERLAAADTPTAAVLLDVDLLKQINDTEGHASGDQAIRALADALSQVVAEWPGGVVGRLGGDEFCVLLPHCSASTAAEVVGDALAELVRRGGPTVSMGVTEVRRPWAPRDLLFAADTNLYEAKNRARSERQNLLSDARRRLAGEGARSSRRRTVRG